MFMAVIMLRARSCHEWQQCHTASISCQLCGMLVGCSATWPSWPSTAWPPSSSACSARSGASTAPTRGCRCSTSPSARPAARPVRTDGRLRHHRRARPRPGRGGRPDRGPGAAPVASRARLRAGRAARAAHARGARILSLCSGAFVLGEAGLLDGRACTTHWRHADELPSGSRWPGSSPRCCTSTTTGCSPAPAPRRASTPACTCGARSSAPRSPPPSPAGWSCRRSATAARRSTSRPRCRTATCETLGPLLVWITDAPRRAAHRRVARPRRSMSPRTFARRFRAETGTTPHAWITSQRVLRAEELLETTDRRWTGSPTRSASATRPRCATTSPRPARSARSSTGGPSARWRAAARVDTRPGRQRDPATVGWSRPLVHSSRGVYIVRSRPSVLVLLLVGALLPLGATQAAAARQRACPVDPAAPARQLRGQWIASVANIDWPSRTGLTADQQQAELRAWLDDAVDSAAERRRRPGPADRRRVLAVAATSRGRSTSPAPRAATPATTRWPSRSARRTRATWSSTPGSTPTGSSMRHRPRQARAEPPGRASTRTGCSLRRQALLQPGPARRSARFIRGRDPGRGHAATTSTRVHFDDYFYPYPVAGQAFDDDAAYAQYGAGFPDAGRDWRRDNIDLLVARAGPAHPRGQAVGQARASARSAVWRNQATDPLG